MCIRLLYTGIIYVYTYRVYIKIPSICFHILHISFINNNKPIALDSLIVAIVI